MRWNIWKVFLCSLALIGKGRWLAASAGARLEGTFSWRLALMKVG